jgi:hypothetical protein
MAEGGIQKEEEREAEIDSDRWPLKQARQI